MFAKIQLYHIGRNRNGSAVTQEAANNSLSGIKYKPVLASIITDEETGIEDFNGHDVEFDDDGNVTYIEKQVGCFTAQDAYIAHDDEHDKDYVFAQCAIPRDYTHAADIIERKGGTDVSVELLVNACSFNAKEKYLELTDIEVAGLTLLGSGTNPGMVGAKLQLEDFAYSEEEPKISFSEDQMNTLIESLDSLKATLQSFNNSDRKEENVVKKKILNEENLNENVQFDGEGGDGGEAPSGDTPGGDTPSGDTPGENEPSGTDDPSGSDPSGGDDSSGTDSQTEEPTADQTAAAAVAETIGALTDESTAEAVEAARSAYDGLTETQQALVSSEVVAALEAQETRIANETAANAVIAAINALTDSSTAEAVEAARDAYDDLTSDQKALVSSTVLDALEAQEARIAAAEEEDDDDDNSSTDLGKKKKNNSLSREMSRDGLSLAINFEVSHEDIRYAIYNLISSWDEEDNDWYMIEKVYDNKFIARGFWTDQLWGSKYTVDGDAVDLDGDRYALHVEYLTDDEQAQLNDMRLNYSALQERVSKYELAELNAQKDEILNSEKYAEYQDVERFKELREHKENYSLEDLKAQCELAFAAQFDKANREPEKQTFTSNKEPKKSPKMFAFLHVEETTNEFLNGLMGRK